MPQRNADACNCICHRIGKRCGYPPCCLRCSWCNQRIAAARYRSHREKQCAKKPKRLTIVPKGDPS